MWYSLGCFFVFFPMPIPPISAGRSEPVLTSFVHIAACSPSQHTRMGLRHQLVKISFCRRALKSERRLYFAIFRRGCLPKIQTQAHVFGEALLNTLHTPSATSLQMRLNSFNIWREKISTNFLQKIKLLLIHKKMFFKNADLGLVWVGPL